MSIWRIYASQQLKKKGLFKKANMYKKIASRLKQIEETANNFNKWYANWESQLLLKSSWHGPYNKALYENIGGTKNK